MGETAQSLALWLPAYVVLKLLIVVPFIRIFSRAGIPFWIALFAIVPFGPIVLLWILAFTRWAGDRQSNDTEIEPSAPSFHWGRYI
jgi:hypothetical protein